MLPVRTSILYRSFRGAAAVRATSRHLSSLSAFATVDASSRSPALVQNLVAGVWKGTSEVDEIPHTIGSGVSQLVPRTKVEELDEFIASMKACPKSGLHNPFRNLDRYLLLGAVSNKAGQALRTPEIADFFAKLIQRTSPKSYAQAMGEVNICAQFLDNFSGDNVRYLARSFGAPGDYDGQVSRGYRVPYGGVALITPFNFPLEIPVLQLMGALYMGNRPVLKVDSKTSVVMDQFLRLLIACGLPPTDVDFINCDGPVMHKLLMKGEPRMTLFTGSSRVAERLAKDLRGKIKIEDAGFDWKILGPDVRDMDYVAYTCDQDAYACSGQKCSAQSMLFVHRNWSKAGILEKLKELAERRSLTDLTCGPVLTWTTEAMLKHVNELLAIPGAKLLFGGKELMDGEHDIPKCYGALQPTAVFVPLRKLASRRYFDLCTKEVFGPVQVVTEYKGKDLDVVLNCLERMTAHLTAAVVSNDPEFTNTVLGSSVNGTTYAGIRARTTGAPQNHWFGPAGDPRGAGIGTREAIQLVWSCHREVISDVGPIAPDWSIPKAT